jgi:hypothetical protein
MYICLFTSESSSPFTIKISGTVNERFTSMSFPTSILSGAEYDGISSELGRTLKMYGLISVVIGCVVVTLLLIVLIQKQSQKCRRQTSRQSIQLEQAPATYESVSALANDTQDYTQLQNRSEIHVLGRGAAQSLCGRAQIPDSNQLGTSPLDRQCPVL